MRRRHSAVTSSSAEAELSLGQSQSLDLLRAARHRLARSSGDPGSVFTRPWGILMVGRHTVEAHLELSNVGIYLVLPEEDRGDFVEHLITLIDTAYADGFSGRANLEPPPPPPNPNPSVNTRKIAP